MDHHPAPTADLPRPAVPSIGVLSLGWVASAALAAGPTSQPASQPAGVSVEPASFSVTAQPATTRPDALRPAFEFSDPQRRHRFFDDFERWAREDMVSAPAPDAVLLIGNSNIRLWKTIATDLAPVQLINRSFGGSNMADVLVFVDFFCRYDVKHIVVYQGGNDFLDQKLTPEALLQRYQAFVARVRAAHPQCRVSFCAVMLGPARLANRDRVLRANELLRAWTAREPGLDFIDLLTPLLDARGNPRADLFRDDRTHLNEQGYALWAPILREKLAEKH